MLIRGRSLLEGGAYFDVIVNDGVLIWDPALISGNAVRPMMLSIVSKNQNKLLKCCNIKFRPKDLYYFNEKSVITHVNNHPSVCCSKIKAACNQTDPILDL